MTEKKTEAKVEPKAKAAAPAEAPAGREPEGIESLGNPWDKAYAATERPPDPLDPKNRTAAPPSAESHIGEMADPTPRERYTVAGQIKAQEQAKEADK